MSDAIERVYRRVLNTVGRGRTTYVDDTQNVQFVQVKLGAEEVKDGLPRLAEYGFSSALPDNSDAVVLFIGGERSNGVVIATGNQTYRMRSLASGEVAISDDKGQSVYLTKAGIVIDGGANPITITAPGGLNITGPVTVNGYPMDETHTHTGGTISGNTGAVIP